MYLVQLCLPIEYMIRILDSVENTQRIIQAAISPVVRSILVHKQIHAYNQISKSDLLNRKIKE
jgi:hypothetical protein